MAPRTVALLCAVIGITAFDGAAEGRLWNSITQPAQDAFMSLGLSRGTALQIVFTLGMIALIALVGAVYRIGVLGMRSVDPTRRVGRLAAAFGHSLVPIALAYFAAAVADPMQAPATPSRVRIRSSGVEIGDRSRTMSEWSRPSYWRPCRGSWRGLYGLAHAVP